MKKANSFIASSFYWFPLSERGLATSAFDAAAKFSNVIGAPLVALAITVYGWRAGFWVTGMLSLIYAIVFWIGYRDPKEARLLSEEERRYIVEGGAQQEERAGESATWADTWTNIMYLLRQRKIWAMTLGFAAYGYSFYLLMLGKIEQLPSPSEKRKPVAQFTPQPQR